MSKIISRLEVLPVRNAFKYEAHDFTKWLEANIDALADRLSIQLTVVQRENSVGDFKVDLLCEDSFGHPVIIENQLERTDHDHLGKMLTYLVNLGATTAIWITTEPRNEHQRVVEWLNESTPADVSFFLVKVEAVRIGESPFAPLFTVLVSPDIQSKQIGEKKKEWAERHFKRLEFWRSLLEKCKLRTKLFANVSPGRNNWIGVSAGKSGIRLNFVLWKDSAAIELYIDHDTEGQGNKRIFDQLFREKAEIELEIGEGFEWERLDDKRACRIRKEFVGTGFLHEDQWNELQEKLLEGMIRLDWAFRERVSKL